MVILSTYTYLFIYTYLNTYALTHTYLSKNFYLYTFHIIHLFIHIYSFDIYLLIFNYLYVTIYTPLELLASAKLAPNCSTVPGMLFLCRWTKLTLKYDQIDQMYDPRSDSCWKCL